MLALSYLDGTTLVPIQVDVSTGGIQIDQSHTIQFTPTAIAERDNNHYPIMMGVDSVTGTPLPVLADPATGGILVDIT